ncbi:hypothetical protein M434DRAFT_30491 [Hypoxylon sp. CO27-5]|nr:hypothetical protein M434DRAFT_30491 [Hypoxylon sp. CO27-5]
MTLDNPLATESLTYELLDYISGQLVRLFDRAVEGNEWIPMCIAILSRMMAKLKVILKDPVNYAHNSIDKGSELRTSAEFDAVNSYKRQVSGDSSFKTFARRRAFIVDDITPTVRYYNTMFKLRLHMSKIFDTIIEGIAGPENQDNLASGMSYELNNIACENPDQPLWSIFKNRRNEILVTSEETMLRICSAGWLLARRDLNYLAQAERTPSGQRLGTVEWEGGVIESSNRDDGSDSVNSVPVTKSSNPHSQTTCARTGSFDIIDASELVMVHVLLAISSMFVVRDVHRILVHMAVYAEQDRHPVAKENERFDMRFSIIIGSREDLQPAEGEDWTPLSDFKLPRKYFQENQVESIALSPERAAGDLLGRLRQFYHHPHHESDDLEKGLGKPLVKDEDEVASLVASYKYWNKTVMWRWTLNDNCVAVPCKRYVLTLMSIWE